MSASRNQFSPTRAASSGWRGQKANSVRKGISTRTTALILRIPPCSLLAGLCFFVASQVSDAATILDYTPPASQTPLYALSPGVPVSYASRFTVGGQDVEITSIEFRLDGLPPMSYDFTAYLFSNSVDRPGALVGSSHQ